MFVVTLFGDAKAQPVDQSFNYQGELLDQGSPASGVYDFQIQAHGDPVLTDPIGNQVEVLGVDVDQGQFFLPELDLGSNALDGLSIWLEIRVKSNADAQYETLSPRQKLLAVPYASTLIDKGAQAGQILTFDQTLGWLPGDDADQQSITGLALNGTTLTVGIENGNSDTVDLSGLQDGTGTDDQTLSLVGTDLSITDGNTVDLSPLQDGTGTDDQTLSLVGTDLSITDGNTVDLSPLQDGTGTDSQTLSLNGPDLSISNGNSVNIPQLLYEQQINGGAITTIQNEGGRFQAVATAIDTGSFSPNQRTVPIPQAILENYCGDLDGCRIILGMRNWFSGTVHGELVMAVTQFHYDPVTRYWRTQEDNGAFVTGIDNSNTGTHIVMDIYSGCFFTDSVFINAVNQNDNEVGMHLLYWSAYVNLALPVDQIKRCELTVID
ncbi:hypothetical protein [Marinicella meishanensis]|uniref:hypothetical protein n=1 Tax=Marinicella meishanensis TaxID=2873263 RepID=UPI001CBEB968|nr:hypothetical protein [Marinicella sp. NBU2979]